MFPIQIHLILLHTFLLETIFFMSKYTQQSPDGSHKVITLVQSSKLLCMDIVNFKRLISKSNVGAFKFDD